MSTMYQLPAVIPNTFTHIDTTVRMYKLAPIQGNMSPHEDGNVDVAALEARQMSILDRLQSLQHRVETLKAPIPRDSVQLHPLMEIVVHASPSNPPYSLPLVINMLQKRCNFKVMITTYVHSSYSKPLPQRLHDFLPPSNSSERSQANVRVALIWKDVGIDPVCFVGMLPSVSVKGEVNLLRFMGRLFGLCGFEKEGSIQWKEDQVLDQIHSDLMWGDVMNDKKSLMNKANDLVKEKPLNPELVLSDLLTYSALKTIFVKSPPPVAKFIHHCESVCCQQGKGESNQGAYQNKVVYATIKNTSKSDRDKMGYVVDAYMASFLKEGKSPSPIKWKGGRKDKNTKDTFPYQFPELQCVMCHSCDCFWTMAEDKDKGQSMTFSITEKLDGSCMAIGSEGFIASRRKFLVKDRPDADGLKGVKFSGSSLISVKEHLAVDIMDLKLKLQGLLGVTQGVEALVYGEWINKGTACSNQDKYNYHSRGIKPGTFHAFAIGLYVNSDDSLFDEIRYKLNQSGQFSEFKFVFIEQKGQMAKSYWYACLNRSVESLLKEHRFKTVPYFGDLGLTETFVQHKSKLMPPFQMEGVILNPSYSCSLPLKWKNKSSDTHSNHNEIWLDFIHDSLKDAVPAMDWATIIDALNQTMVTHELTSDEELLYKLYLSAVSKYSTLDDSIHNLKGKQLWKSKKHGQSLLTEDNLLDSLFHDIYSEMVADLPPNPKSTVKVEDFLDHMKKNIKHQEISGKVLI